MARSATSLPFFGILAAAISRVTRRPKAAAMVIASMLLMITGQAASFGIQFLMSGSLSPESMPLAVGALGLCATALHCVSVALLAGAALMNDPVAETSQQAFVSAAPAVPPKEMKDPFPDA